MTEEDEGVAYPPEPATGEASSSGADGARIGRGRIAAAFAAVLVCGLAAGGVLAWSSAGDTSTVDQDLPEWLAQDDGASGPTTVAPAAEVVEPLGGAGPQLVYISRAADHYGKVVVAAGSPPEPIPVDLACERVHVGPTRVLCLQSGGLSGVSGGVVLDRAFEPVDGFGLGGLPSRARLSPDGRMAAYTQFVTGHSYNGGGEFSTATALIDLDTGWQTNLESLAVLADGAPVEAADRNFWGVTFTADSNRFYATMKVGPDTFLVEGDLAAGRIEVLDRDAECPSLSPDGSQLVFKVPVSGGYHLVRYDLATRERTSLDAAGLVDDQVEWLDDDTIVYGVGRTGPKGERTADIWALDLAEGAEARLVVADAESPAVVRG